MVQLSGSAGETLARSRGAPKARARSHRALRAPLWRQRYNAFERLSAASISSNAAQRETDDSGSHQPRALTTTISSSPRPDDDRAAEEEGV